VPADRSQNNFTTTVLAENLVDAIAVAFHYKDKLLFWTDVSSERILRKSLQKDSQVETVVSVGLVRPEGMAIDWVTNKIYWTDSHLKLIEVVNLDGTQRSVLFWNNLDQPRAIVVDPSHG
jgi:low density lipoprotein receptor-related protein 5/6